MNERWKDLIKQAIQEIGPEDRPSKEETLKRYAELIVRECIKICSDVEADSEMDLSDGALVCMAEIKEHFGVEE
jgi:hypothetical protein